jgi:hypothetical protein
MKGSLSSILLLLRMRMPCRASRTGIKTSTPRSFVKLPSSRFTVTVKTGSPATDRLEILPVISNAQI